MPINHISFSSAIKRAFSALGIMLFLILLIPAQTAQAQGLSLIRDAEIETMLRKWSEPAIKAAQLDPESINFILVQDPNLNAFVAGGPNIFIFTGLLTESENPAEVVGVIAHELGHIRGGHLVRARGAMENASYESILGTIVGIGAAVLTGEGGLATAIIAGSNSTAYNKYLAFNRVQEASADQAALDYLEKAQMDPVGLVSFMKKLEDQELLPATQQSQYIRTHPLTRDRISALTAGRDRSPYKDMAYPPEWKEDHNRMIAKLVGFITPEQVNWKYDDRDQSIAADYARTIAAYRQNDVTKSLKLVDSLLSREPNNPYFLELKGQMLVDFGHVDEALPPYKKSVVLLPNASLIRIAYAHALIEDGQNNADQLNRAIEHLKRALKDESRSPRIHRLLATAYGRTGREAQAKLHLAEEALLKGEIPYAKRQAEAALASLPKGSNPWLRAQDILNYIEQVAKNN